jgi:hypothetical protein
MIATKQISGPETKGRYYLSLDLAALVIELPGRAWRNGTSAIRPERHGEASAAAEVLADEPDRDGAFAYG